LLTFKFLLSLPQEYDDLARFASKAGREAFLITPCLSVAVIARVERSLGIALPVAAATLIPPPTCAVTVPASHLGSASAPDVAMMAFNMIRHDVCVVDARFGWCWVKGEYGDWEPSKRRSVVGNQ
jgi:hypothetical protein